MYLLSHKHCEATVEGKMERRDEKCFPNLIKIS